MNYGSDCGVIRQGDGLRNTAWRTYSFRLLANCLLNFAEYLRSTFRILQIVLRPGRSNPKSPRQPVNIVCGGFGAIRFGCLSRSAAQWRDVVGYTADVSALVPDADAEGGVEVGPRGVGTE